MPEPIELFKPGTHGSRTFSEADVREIVETYDPALHRAPFVIGHPQRDDPAWGWVNGLEFVNGGLWNPDYDIFPEFAEILHKKLFRTRSIALYDRHDPANPTPGKYYLKHVGWLGAVPPKVKGLGDVAFAETSQTLIIEFAEEMDEPKDAPQEAPPLADLLKKLMQDSGMDVNALAETLGADPARVAEAAGETAPEPEEEPAEFAEKRQSLAAREAALAAREKAADRKELLAFCEDLGGRILPRHTDEVVAFMQELPTDVELAFSEGRKQPLLDWFKGFLMELPEQLRFGEIAKPGKTPVQFDPKDGKAIAAEIKRVQKDEKLTFAEATAKVAGGLNPQ